MHKMCYLYLHILCSTAISRSFMSCRLEDILIFVVSLCLPAECDADGCRQKKHLK